MAGEREVLSAAEAGRRLGCCRGTVYPMFPRSVRPAWGDCYDLALYRTWEGDAEMTMALWEEGWDTVGGGHGDGRSLQNTSELWVGHSAAATLNLTVTTSPALLRASAGTTASAASGPENGRVPLQSGKRAHP